MNRLENWLAWKHPVLMSKIQSIQMELKKRSWERYMKKHRSCCESTVLHYCAKKVFVNPKKACCWGYIPERCEECGRKIPRWMLWKYMKLSLYIEHAEEAKEEYKKQIAQQRRKK